MNKSDVERDQLCNPVSSYPGLHLQRPLIVRLDRYELIDLSVISHALNSLEDYISQYFIIDGILL